MPDSDVDYAYQCGREAGRKEREAEVEAAFRAGAEAVIAYVRINARAEGFECCDWFSSSTVIDDGLLDVINIKALWAEYKKGHR